MLWLIWQMWFLLALALGIGVVIGWRIWGASPDSDGRSLAAARDEVERLRRENDDLHRSLALARRDRETTGQPIAAAGTPAPPAIAEPVLGEDEDDLQAIKGLGPKAAQALKAGGVVRYSQIAAWTADDIAQWDTDLGARGRIVRDDWVGQAKTLSVR
ncbi:MULTISPECIES: hypothetical protein [Hyphobacterium]|uniref:Uncharacterized protein n=1 Tax=Hyphobacterium vulgare TaxID=1736751 RepID=A0ABV7A0A9_9PROT